MKPHSSFSRRSSTKGNPLDGVARYRFVLVVAARSRRHAMPSMLDGVTDIGAERMAVA